MTEPQPEPQPMNANEAREFAAAIQQFTVVISELSERLDRIEAILKDRDAARKQREAEENWWRGDDVSS